ncbi:MAG: hypothetical protein AAFY88_10270, partial [Acidobacteriota bacterium]
AVVLSHREDEIFLEGGWTRGLRRGDELRAGDAVVQLTDVNPVRSRARRLEGKSQLATGTVLNRIRLGASDEPDLVVFMPEATLEGADLLELEAWLVDALRAAGRRHLGSLDAAAPSHIVRFRRGTGWELVARGAIPRPLGPEPGQDAWRTAIRDLPEDAQVFIQLPLPRGLGRHVDIGDGRSYDRIGVTEDPDAAHYQLVGRQEAGQLTYRWIRPGGALDVDNPLPSSTRAVALGTGTQAPILLGLDLAALTVDLARLRFWLRLPSPDVHFFPYRLALYGVEGPLPADVRKSLSAPVLRKGQQFGLALVRRPELAPIADGRHVYVLLIDADGRQQLLFPHPRYGSVENRLPLDDQLRRDAAVIPFGEQPLITISEPTGLDTYLLLTTEEPIPDPLVLSREGVRAPRESDHPLARLFLESQRGTRSTATLPTRWSVHRLHIEVQEP